MTQSPTATKYREALNGLKALIDARRGAGDWLELATECLVGMHAQDATFQACGIYILPVADKARQDETQTFVHPLEVRVVIQYQSRSVDAGQTDSPTLLLTDLVAGVFDVFQANRNITLQTSGQTATLFLSDERDAIPFTVVPLLPAGLLYSADVNMRIEFET